MNIATILKEKKTVWEKIKKDFNFPLKNKATGLVSLSDKDLTANLIEGLSKLDVNFIIKSDSINISEFKNIVFINKDFKDLVWLDFVLCDECESNMTSYFSAWVAPVVSKDNHISTLLSEFNPGRVEGNAYIFKENNSWEVFYALIRYLENFKFPYDNKALVKNILEI